MSRIHHFLKINTLGIILLSVFMLLLNSCITYKDIEVEKVEFRNIKNVTSKGFDVHVAIHVNNPNKYRIHIVKAHVDLLLSDEKVGAAAVDKKMTLKGQTSEEYIFIINAEYKGLASSAIPSIISIATSGTIPLRAKGNMKARAYWIGKKVEVDYYEKMRIR